MSELQLDAEHHIYTRNGKVLPSVTQIIKPITEYSSMISEEVMEHAARRGRAVHKACEIIDMGLEFAEPLDEEIVPYVDAWKLFCAEKRVTITATEQILFHPTMHYAGTFDAIGMIGNDEWLIDRKAITQLTPAIGVQTAGYAGMLGRKVRRAAVQLKPDGKYIFEEYPLRTDWPVFVACLTVFNFKHNHAK